MAENGDGLMRIDVDTIKREAREISTYVEKGKIGGLTKKYQKFHDNFPILFKNIVEKTMSIEEVEVLLDTFNRAQEHLIQNSQ